MRWMPEMSKRVLVPLVAGFEEIETIAPVDLLRRAGAEVVMAALSDDLLVKGRSNIFVQADACLEDLDPQSFDLLFLPGGPGVQVLREDGRSAALAREFSDRNLPVAAICAAPTILKDAGLLEKKRHTAHFSVRGELPDSLADERVVIDGNILTSRGAGTALDFGLALVQVLYGREAADRIAASILF